MHIDMKLNVMHILAKLGFLEFIIYIGFKKVKHAIWYTFGKYACTRLSRTKRRYSLNKTPNKPKMHTKVWREKRLSKIYQRIKLRQSWFQSSTSEQSKTNEQKELTKYTRSKTYLILRSLKQILRYEITNSQWEQGSNK